MSADTLSPKLSTGMGSAPLLSPDASRGAEAALRRLAAVAVLAVLLGLVVQGLVLAALLMAGSDLPAPAAVAVEFARGVTWSLLVCSGVGVATLLIKVQPIVSGLIALCLAPLAVAGAKAAQTVVAGWLAAVDEPALLPLGTVSVLRALEYGLLAWLLGRLVLRDALRPWPFLGVGAAVALLFGGGIAGLTFYAAQSAGAPLPLPKLAATAVNEIASPVGCALVIYWGRLAARHLGAIGAA